MNQGEARNLVLRTTINSLRAAAMHPGRVLRKGSNRDFERVTKECTRLADKLQKKQTQSTKGPDAATTGPHSPEDGADHLPQDGKVPGEGGPGAAAGGDEHKDGEG